MKAVFHFRASPVLQQRLSASVPGWLTIEYVDESNLGDVSHALSDADVLLHVLAPANAALLACAPKLRLIQKIGVGLNTIDLVEARRRSIRVANMPGTNSQAVCECTLALMLAVLRKIIPLDAATKLGKGWALPLGSLDEAGEIAGKTVGLIGFGAIPRRLAPILQALGATVLFHARRVVTDPIGKQVSLKTLLTESNIVSLHVPLTDETKHMINESTLAAMQPGAILINTARGGLIDEAALCRALSSGRLRGVGLDVLDCEPAPEGQPLFTMPNAVITPHVGWLTSETLDRSLEVIIENCARLRDGRALLNEITL